MKQMHNFLICTLSLIVACGTPRKYGKPFLPPAGSRLTFINQQSFPGYAEQELPRPFGLAFYAGLGQEVSVEWRTGARIRSLDSLLEQLDSTAPLILLRLTNNQMIYMPTGKHDERIRALAQTLKKYRQPIYLAPGYEVNNPRFEMDPQAYVQGCRYFVQKLREQRVRNVSFVYHVIAMKPRWDKPIHLNDCYPGDAYVNWLGLSVQNTSPHHFPEDGYFEGPLYDQVATFAHAHNLPIMICESSTRSVAKNYGFTGDSLWADWYQPFFKLLSALNARALSHTFYGYDDEVILSRWREEMSKTCYLHAHPQPHRVLGRGIKSSLF